MCAAGEQQVPKSILDDAMEAPHSAQTEHRPAVKNLACNSPSVFAIAAASKNT